MNIVTIQSPEGFGAKLVLCCAQHYKKGTYLTGIRANDTLPLEPFYTGGFYSEWLPDLDVKLNSAWVVNSGIRTICYLTSEQRLRLLLGEQVAKDDWYIRRKS